MNCSHDWHNIHFFDNSEEMFAHVRQKRERKFWIYAESVILFEIFINGKYIFNSEHWKKCKRKCEYKVPPNHISNHQGYCKQHILLQFYGKFGKIPL